MYFKNTDNKWYDASDMDYYYRSDGRILGATWHYVLKSAVWSAKIYTDEFPFTNSSEKYLGHFIDQSSAKKAVENYWNKMQLTLESSSNENSPGK